MASVIEDVSARWLAHPRGMGEKEPQVDVSSLRARFPWVGLASIENADLSALYREILAEARRDRGDGAYRSR
jgi:hypothetical protein